jgi:hypothetical protein
VDGVDAAPPIAAARLRRLQALGVLSGVTAGAWLGAAEAPTKLVTLGIPPVAISFVMVLGVFLARWSLPALIRGSAGVRADLARAPHLVVWALLGGGLWAVANTLTVYAIRDVGLAIAFPLWNARAPALAGRRRARGAPTQDRVQRESSAFASANSSISAPWTRRAVSGPAETISP